MARVSASEDRFCCVLEDDVELQAGFAENLAALCNQAQVWDVVRLYGVFRRDSAKLLELTPGRWLVDYFEQPRGTQGYVQLAAAERLLRHTEKMSCAIDDAIDRGWEHKLRLYGIEPYLVIEQLQHASTIGNRKRAPLTLWRRISREIHRSKNDMFPPMKIFVATKTGSGVNVNINQNSGIGAQSSPLASNLNSKSRSSATGMVSSNSPTSSRILAYHQAVGSGELSQIAPL